MFRGSQAMTWITCLGLTLSGTGVFLVVTAFGVRLPGLGWLARWLCGSGGGAIACVIGGFAILLAVAISFKSLQLPPELESAEQLRIMRNQLVRRCPAALAFVVAFYLGCFAAVAIEYFDSNIMDEGLVALGLVSIVVGGWFVWVYPVARQIFEEQTSSGILSEDSRHEG